MILKNGTLIGDKYQVNSLLGSGGMGAVYRVTHTHLHKDFALKIIDVHNHNEQAVRRFHLEAKTTAQLKHPNLVAVQDFGVYDDAQPYLVMDLIQGQPLSTVLKNKGALPVDYVVPLAIELARGLLYAHSLGVVHRDIKPGNIIIINPDQKPISGSVKIVDFGIAKLVQSEEGQMQELTRTGEIFGSPIYMSPEQCQGTPIDQRTDIYSLGCVLFECLTGSPPFLAENAMTTMAKRLTNDPETLKDGSLGIDFPQPIEDIIHKMLLLDPKRRYQTFDTVIEDFANFEKGEAKTAAEIGNDDAAKNSQRSKIIDIAMVAATMVIFAAATHYLDVHYFLRVSNPEIVNSVGVIAKPAPVTVSEKIAAKEKIFTNTGLSEQAKAPTLTVGTAGSAQTINFSEYSGHYQVYPFIPDYPAVGPVPASRERPIGLSMSESAASNPQFLKNLSDAYLYSVNFCGAFLVNNASLVQLLQLKHLSGLNLINCAGVTSLSDVAKLHLTNLFIEGTTVSTKDILALPFLTKLDGFGFGPVQDPELILSELQKDTDLFHIGYQGPLSKAKKGEGLPTRGLNSSDLKLIANCEPVTDLLLTNCPEVNDKNISIVLEKKGKKLRTLCFINCNVTPAAIPLLKKYQWGHLEVASNSWSKDDGARLESEIKNAKCFPLLQPGLVQLQQPKPLHKDSDLNQLLK